MNNRLRITFKNIERTEHMVAFIENRFDRLKRISNTIIRCNVVVWAPHRSQKNGNFAQVRIELLTPGKDYIGSSKSHPREGSDLYTAISEGFNSLSKQMRDRKRPSTPPLSSFQKGDFLSSTLRSLDTFVQTH